LTKTDGEKYVGNWHKDKKDGYGSYFWPNGDI